MSRQDPRWTSTLFRISLVMALGVALAGAVVAAPASAAPRPRPVIGMDPGTYTNPLAPKISTGGTVDSCADPTVIRGQQSGDRYWYMYCTTDPLNDADQTSTSTNFRKIPMMRSLDLVNWDYVGEAFTALPSWAGPGASLWAPDIVYSSTFNKYYLTFVVTETNDATSGVTGCRGDSAIGVATGPTATGPWTFSDTPVVRPRQNGGGCNFFWTYDPDVLGDSIGASGVLYYGSYYGGIFASTVALTASGMTADATTATPVTIPNKYEGANVVQNGGYYYLFASATNCCAGPLTGYSVFVGRSTSPLGPFVDREGASLLAGRAGGTPALSMNGNRWVGTGHNTVFQDHGGQWWTVYHAVDQGDPYFAPPAGFTKRPALLDAIDWVDGWPTVNGGRWASDSTQPAPAGQPGQKSRHQLVPVAAQEPGALVASASDEFDGPILDLTNWSWANGRVPLGTARVESGGFRFDTQAADLHQRSNSASVLTRAAPAGSYIVETKVDLDLPAEGCCFNFRQAGLVIYGDDDRFIKLAHFSLWETRQTEFAKEVSTAGGPRYGNTVVGPPATTTYLRVVVERLTESASQAAGGDTERYTAYTSRDGVAWVRGGAWTHSLGASARIGLVSMAGAGSIANFDYVRTYTLG